MNSSGVVAIHRVLTTENLTMAQRKNSTRVKAPTACPIVTASFSTEMTSHAWLQEQEGSSQKQSKQLELTKTMRNQGIDILGLVDYKITHEENINVQQVAQHVITTSSAWRNNANAAVGGVGIAASKNAEDTLAEITKYNNRILVAHFNGNLWTTIIGHYA